MQMKKIKVMGTDVKIVRQKQDDWGNFDGDKNIIYLDEKLTDKQERDILRHELIHAVFFYSGQSFNIGSSELEEGIVRALEYNYLPLLERFK